jgi:hypothetical protein
MKQRNGCNYGSKVHKFGSSLSLYTTMLVGGWALPFLKNMEFVSWDDDIPNIWKNNQMFQATNQLWLWNTRLTGTAPLSIYCICIYIYIYIYIFPLPMSKSRVWMVKSPNFSVALFLVLTFQRPSRRPLKVLFFSQWQWNGHPVPNHNIWADSN